MSTERALQDYLKTTAKKHGVAFYKTTCVGRRGFPDVMLIDTGSMIFVELKSPTGKGRLHTLQTKTIRDMRAQGADVRVVDSKEDCEKIICALTNRRPKLGHRQAV